MGVKKNYKEFDTKPMQPSAVVPLDWMERVKPDPLGSYTGVPEDVLDKPVQDADDL